MLWEFIESWGVGGGADGVDEELGGGGGAGGMDEELGKGKRQ